MVRDANRLPITSPPKQGSKENTGDRQYCLFCRARWSCRVIDRQWGNTI